MRIKASFLPVLLLCSTFTCPPAALAQQVSKATLIKDVRKDIISEDGNIIGFATIPAGSRITVNSVTGDGIMINREGEPPFKANRDCISSNCLSLFSTSSPTPAPAAAQETVKSTPIPTVTSTPSVIVTSTPDTGITSAPSVSAGKKGVGLAERKKGFGAHQLEELNASWYYNWGDKTHAGSHAEFIPMIFSLKSLDSSFASDYVLGYNEPDNEKQSNISVGEALKGWHLIVSKGKLVGSPATARNPVTSQWLHEFMDAHPKVDFVTVHWYKGVKAEHLIRDLKEVHATYGLPVWVTEFAPQTAAESRLEPKKHSQKEVDKFISETVKWMESTPWVQRYAWHDSGEGTSALFNGKGELTETGKTYSKADSFSK